ncbi:hypothetical protein CN533_27210 [Priestia megaterium]|uniref:hypothetical protein n=1 Tax=Priestia megaterium TaxID=1404 RepID=UPI000BF4694D|nr:hypothetical protein [Priestia megaterium]PET68280.1 hypothetical protein CN533_27210 [Priestia megaterium]PFK82633.1 hypothetical protein COJ19_25755 [Priestia megaterium]
MENNWYDVIEPTENISQGDILFNCPLFIPIYPSDDLSPADFNDIEERELETEVKRANVIILNQACDLEVREGKDRPKLESVLVAALQDVRKTGVGKNKLTPISKLEKSQLFLLDPSYKRVRMGYQIVHFDSLISLPWKLLNTYSKVAHGERLRLCSPYLEQMSAHFGSHFGRVAIPENREQVLNDFFTIKQDYEIKKKDDRRAYPKEWHQLSEEEVYAFMQETKST